MATPRIYKPLPHEVKRNEALAFIVAFFGPMKFYASVMYTEDYGRIIASVCLMGELDEASCEDLRTRLEQVVLPLALSINFVDWSQYP